MKRLWRHCLALLLLSLPAHAALGLETASDLHFIGRYVFDWEGVALAAAELSLEQDKDSYRIHLAVDSRGVVNLFTHHKSDTITTGRREGDKYLPDSYESHYWTKKKPRHIKLAFDKKGVVTEETVEPPEDPTERPIVPHGLKDGTIDPLTVILAIRSGNLKPRVFDAKHLWDGTAAPRPALQPLTISGKPAIRYVVSRKPVAGLTRKESNEYAKGEPPLSFYYTLDALHIPIYMSMPIYLGKLEGSLVKQCKTWDECRID